MRFQLGRLLITPGALLFCRENSINVFGLVKRHEGGDWSDLDQEDRAANERALLEGTRVFSAYKFPQGKLWVITEADRSATTVLLPEEY